MGNFSVSRTGVKTMLVGLIMMIAGFILMIGGGSDDPEVFNEAMFSTVRLTVAPIVILLGIAVVMVGILRKPKKEE